MSGWDVALSVTGLVWVASLALSLYRLWSEVRSVSIARLRQEWAEEIGAEEPPPPSRRAVGTLDEAWERHAAETPRELFPTLTRWLSGRRFATWLEVELQKAHSGWRLSTAVAAALLLSTFTFTMTAILVASFAPTSSPFAKFLFAFFTASLVPVGGFYWLRHLHRQFIQRVELILPDTLSLIANALRAGMGLQQALEIVATEGLPPLREEFAVVNRSITLGTSIENAFHNLLLRVPSAELMLVVTAVLVQREVGGSLAQIFETAANTVRARLRLRRELRTVTSQARASAVFLAFVLPAFLFIAINLVTMLTSGEAWSAPMFYDPMGHKALGLIVLLQVGGWIWVSRIMQLQE